MEQTDELILPPPELRLVIDKTAGFVAKNGKAFEEKILEKNRNNLKFDFLNASNPFHRYYLDKVDDIALSIHHENKSQSAEIQNKASEGEIIREPQLNQFSSTNASGLRADDNFGLEAYDDYLIAKVPHPNLSSYSIAAQISHAEIEVIKLTALYTAVLGQKFLDSLTLTNIPADDKLNRDNNAGINNFSEKDRENLRPYFEKFLFPQRSRFHAYFLKLVEVYSLIADPEAYSEIKKKFTERYSNRKSILERCAKRVDMLRDQKLKEKEQKDGNDDFVTAIAAVDWDDFIVVETISFDDIMPAVSHVLNDIVNEPLKVDEQAQAFTRPKPGKLKVVQGYKPKVVTAEERDKTVILPTGEKISAEEMNEHVKIDLIDPESRTQKRKYLERKENNPYDEMGMAENLKRFAAAPK